MKKEIDLRNDILINNKFIVLFLFFLSLSFSWIFFLFFICFCRCFGFDFEQKKTTTFCQSNLLFDFLFLFLFFNCNNNHNKILIMFIFMLLLSWHLPSSKKIRKGGLNVITLLKCGLRHTHTHKIIRSRRDCAFFLRTTKKQYKLTSNQNKRK